MKKTLLILAGAAIIAACNSTERSSSATDSAKTDTSTVKKEAAAPEAKPEEKNTWVMKTDTDKMTSKERYFAMLLATNQLEFDAPYDGGSTASITLRNQNKSTDVLLQIDKGQFNCDITDGCTVNIRFDNDPAIKFTGSEPSDGSSTMLFISPEKKFITNLKKAKKMIVQAEFYQSGLKTMEFNVEGLTWDH